MRNDLRISMVQSPIVWENQSANLSDFEKRLSRVKGKTDLVILPEMFTTGFSTKSVQLAETIDGNTMQTVKQWAADFGFAIAGTFIASEKTKYFNRAFFVTPEGDTFFYDKRHLFSIGNENEYFTEGKEKLIVSYKGWNICLLICYDLRYPVWSRNRNNQYDLLIYMANWPKSRSSVWRSLLMARSLENQSYVCGVNRTGIDGMGLEYSGKSVIISPKGKIIADAYSRSDIVRTCILSAKEQESFRRKFPVSLDADSYTINK